MRILIACEFSGVCRRAFRDLGHEAFSCDLLPAADGDNKHHLQIDVLDAIHAKWDMMIAFPPCTDLCVSGAKHFARKRADGTQARSINFFMALAQAKIPRIAIENPVGIMSSVWRKPDQIIQPWMFGHPESKATCLWLKNLPPLRPTNILPKPSTGRWQNQTPSGQNKLGPSENRWKLRSTTYRGIAEAMAQQWSGLSSPTNVSAAKAAENRGVQLVMNIMPTVPA